MGDTEFIPTNPLIHSKGINERIIANTATRVEPKVTVVIPPPPVDIRVDSTPAPRRSFVQPPVVMHDQVFRSRR
jgi:hypothetical protein